MRRISNLCGIVVCGGQSSRMGTDKSMIEYHGKPQRYYLYEMLEEFADRVFISCNKQQASQIPDEYNVIADSSKYTEIGPMGGIMSAFKRLTDATLLIVGCDYPFLKKEDIQCLVEYNMAQSIAATYYHEKEQIREPLLGIYKKECAGLLLKQFETNNYSLNYFLKEINADKIIPSNPQDIQSIDTPGTYQNALKKLMPKNPEI